MSNGEVNNVNEDKKRTETTNQEKMEAKDLKTQATEPISPSPDRTGNTSGSGLALGYPDPTTKIGIIVGVSTAIIAVLIGLVFTLLSARISDISKYADSQFSRIENRFIRIEDKISLERPLTKPMTSSSPIAITDFGHGMLNKSGMGDLLAKYQTKLIEKAKRKGLSKLSTPADIDEVTKELFDDYEGFKDEDTKVIDNYIYEHCEGKMFNIWEIGAIRFRDIVLEYFGKPVPTAEDN